MSSMISDFKEWVSNNLVELSRIKNINEIGDCYGMMEGCLREIPDDYSTKEVCIYRGDDRGFIEERQVYDLPLRTFNIIENNSIYPEYVVHYVTLVDDCYIIDPTHPENIDGVSDVCFDLDEYKAEIMSINKHIDDLNIVVKVG